MRKAQVENGRIVNVIEVDPNDIPEWCVDWPDADQAGPGWLQLPDGTFAPEAAPPMPRDEAIKTIAQMIDAAAAVITGPVPEVERLSWTAKETAARAWRDGIAPPEMVALLTIEASTRVETLADLADRIIRNADLYRAAVALMTGHRRKALADLDAGEDADVVIAQLADTLAVITNAG